MMDQRCRHHLPLRTLLLCLVMLYSVTSRAQDGQDKPPTLNIIVASRIRTFDLAALSFQAQAGIQKIFHRRTLCLVYVDSIQEAAARIEKLVARKKAGIRYLWFDSHGHFGRRLSLFEVGKDEVNHQTIHETHIADALHRIGTYCDTNTIIGIGSCYSAAGFTQPAIDSFPEQRMNGDSLLQLVSHHMNHATVYGSRSWVMTKPFIFGASYALSGGPSAIRFKDPLLLPVWETIGQWLAYDGKTGSFRDIPPVALDGRGNIFTKEKNYLDLPRNKKKQTRTIQKLRSDNYLPKWFVKYQLPKHYRK